MSRRELSQPPRDCLASDRREEMAIEPAPRELAHDPVADGVDQLVAVASDVEAGRPVEQDRFDAVDRVTPAPCAG